MPGHTPVVRPWRPVGIGFRKAIFPVGTGVGESLH
jgi:hypothetical protein